MSPTVPTGNSKERMRPRVEEGVEEKWKKKDEEEEEEALLAQLGDSASVVLDKLTSGRTTSQPSFTSRASWRLPHPVRRPSRPSRICGTTEKAPTEPTLFASSPASTDPLPSSSSSHSCCSSSAASSLAPEAGLVSLRAAGVGGVDAFFSLTIGRPSGAVFCPPNRYPFALEPSATRSIG
ncbi:unnamed protein product [Protopolystoma xenopodis]|uniref:Uncharacterized protein n=1 Tax=Protopolystoma xenopodis TaxID=117903 RepID=A0A3S5CUU7_9PLAT|nr:unnamed protein product [Protopolystoma xenopodis]